MFLRIVLLPALVFAPLHLSVLWARHAGTLSTAGLADFSPAILFFAVLIVVYAALELGRYAGSPAVPSLTLTLLGIGIAVQHRIGTLATVQFDTPSQFAVPAGVLAMLVAWLVLRYERIAWLEKAWIWILGAAVAVIAAVLALGHAFRGATFVAGGMNPVEIVKPLLVVGIAALLSGHRKLLRRGFLGIPFPPINVIVTIAVFWCLPMALLIAQGDMGMFALMNLTLLVMLAVVTSRSFYILGGFAAVFAAAAYLIPLTTRGRARLAAWSDPFASATSTGWQPLQALVALYSGGLFGTGLGNGSPNAVPIVESDFAYVIIGEELGFVGCIIVVLLYIALVVSGIRIAQRATSAYSACVAAGITACLGLQTLFNIGGVVKAIPLTGIPLPLLSHGGSSMVTTLLMAGLLLAISDEHRNYAVRTTGVKKRRMKDGE